MKILREWLTGSILREFTIKGMVYEYVDLTLIDLKTNKIVGERFRCSDTVFNQVLTATAKRLIKKIETKD